MLLEDRVAIVTGGAKEIGLHISLGLAEEGARVVIADVDEKAGKEAVRTIGERYGREALYLDVDVSKESQVRDMVQSVVERFSSVSILVNNAGIMGPVERIEDITEEEWDKTFAVNIKRMVFCSKHAVPHMKDKKEGCIVNIASISGKRALPLRLPYTTTKMGVIGFSRSLAAEVGEWGIRVNSVCPGSVTGARQEHVFRGIMKATGKSWDQVKKEKAEVTALKTFVDPVYIANCVVFLCSDKSWVITGQDINVCGGSIMY